MYEEADDVSIRQPEIIHPGHHILAKYYNVPLFQGYYGPSASTTTYEPFVEEVDNRLLYRYSSATSDIPEVIKQFIQYFHLAIKEKRLYDIQDLYENT